MSTAPFPVVLISDPAIDEDASDFAAFLRERDPRVLAYRDGHHPTVYHCRPLTLQERRDVRNKATDPDRFEAAFVRGLVRVERLYHPNGSRGDWRRETDKAGKERPVSDRDIEALFSELVVQEVGSVIWFRSSLPFHPDYAACYQLLDISHRALVATKLRHAELLAKSAGDKVQQEAPQQATQSSSSD